jgi:hypothetical protein
MQFRTILNDWEEIRLSIETGKKLFFHYFKLGEGGLSYILVNTIYMQKNLWQKKIATVYGYHNIEYVSYSVQAV